MVKYHTTEALNHAAKLSDGVAAFDRHVSRDQTNEVNRSHRKYPRNCSIIRRATRAEKFVTNKIYASRPCVPVLLQAVACAM